MVGSARKKESKSPASPTRKSRRKSSSTAKEDAATTPTPRSRTRTRSASKEDVSLVDDDETRLSSSSKKSKTPTAKTPAKTPPGTRERGAKAVPTSSGKKKKTPKKSPVADADVEEDIPASSSKKDAKKGRRSQSSISKKRQDNEENDDPMEIEDTPPAPADSKTTKTTHQKRPPTVDVHVHRLRDLEYQPFSVVAMAKYGDQVALTRSNGSYELYQVSSTANGEGRKSPLLMPLASIAGMPGAIAHSLVFIFPSICVAGSPDGSLWLVHWSTGQLSSRIASGGGGIFDLVTLKTMKHSSKKDVAPAIVAAACHDGSVRFFQIVTKKTTTIVDVPLLAIPPAGAAVLSLAWQQVPTGTNSTTETVLYTAIADGTIRQHFVSLSSTSEDNSMTTDEMMISATARLYQLCISTTNKKKPVRITMESRGRRTATKVWSMIPLEDGTLVTGNSLGQVQFWNTSTGTLQQASINQTDLKADVLQLVVNDDETKVFCSGVDARVVCLERPAADHSAHRTWRLTNAQRPHSHDIQAMVIVSSATTATSNSHGSSTSLETLLTAGVDTKLCSYVVHDFAKRRPHVWYPWPSVSPISTSETGLVAMRRLNQIELYQLDDDTSKAPSEPSSQSVGDILLENSKSNLAAAVLSRDGKWMATANTTSLFVFSLMIDDDNHVLKTEQVELPSDFGGSVGAIHFHDNLLFVADAVKNQIRFWNVEERPENCSILRMKRGTTEASDNSLPIDSIRTSHDGTYLVALRKQTGNAVAIFKRQGEGSEQTPLYHPHWVIPAIQGQRAAAFCFTQDHQVAVCTFSNHVYLFDLQDRKLSEWSEKHGFPIREWPMDLTSRQEVPIKLTVNPDNPEQLFMVSFGSFVVIDLSKDMPIHCRVLPETHVRKRKRLQHGNSKTCTGKRNSQQSSDTGDPGSHCCTICLHYNSILYLDFSSSKEMVVVEQPWLRVVSTFPPALQRRVYGLN